ncbi:methyltransferase type 11 [Listeria floridensis FSL S10-1187]|uniref:Methyltransferase type 11 n=1 Tax=Listeria floridensis FSL S10-1187 TaxID=1265817 RepID=A0ABP3AZD3_9LIST|nr:class I SAM-dependent methyltransferase [Listeria floridensis]EUJ32939.1 methyltransferase type 11 [Listeria floridensis FSL S10-1187]
MVENRYDDADFFEKYSQMDRSVKGLDGAGEWQTLQTMLPDFSGKEVLDLGCGFGWHCIYAAEHGAKSVVGVDISEKMLEQARAKTEFDNIHYVKSSIEAAEFNDNQFDSVISSLALHYVESFEQITKKVRRMLKPGGKFVFSVEHPVFTAEGSGDWIYDARHEIDHFPVDHYFFEGKRTPHFLGEEVVKYHKTLTTYLNGLLQNGFRIDSLAEPIPPENMMEIPGMKDELRRPMMLIIAATNEK